MTKRFQYNETFLCHVIRMFGSVINEHANASTLGLITSLPDVLVEKTVGSLCNISFVDEKVSRRVFKNYYVLRKVQLVNALISLLSYEE